MILEIQKSPGPDWIDLTKYIEFGGLKYSREDIEGPNAGQMLDGSTVRDRLASKARWDVTCRKLKSEELALVLTLIKPESFNVRYLDPETNNVVTGTFFTSSNNARYKLHRANGDEEIWEGVAFQVTEM